MERQDQNMPFLLRYENVAWYDQGKVRIHFKNPQRAITRGQAVVLYRGDRLVGGGTILR